ncbi:MAG TPA: holo-ACP synthase [Pyrinomonadaceae bacterium]|nr:holo-ACP synthase [Pyrinomonadaceae bacterium]
MILRTGVDLIEISRVAETIARHGDHFLKRVFTPGELEYCKNNHASLAARFAAKEAVSKALGCGIGDVGWLDIEIAGDENKAPILMLHGAAEKLAKDLGLHSWSISLSHTHEHAIALVVAAE